MGWISPFKLNQLGMLNMNRRNVDYISRYNSRAFYPLVDNKLKTKLVVAEYDVPTPRLLQVVRQQHEISRFREIAADLKGFAIKPAKGSGGKGITVITGRDNEDYVKASGARVNISYLASSQQHSCRSVLPRRYARCGDYREHRGIFTHARPLFTPGRT